MEERWEEEESRMTDFDQDNDAGSGGMICVEEDEDFPWNTDEADISGNELEYSYIEESPGGTRYWVPLVDSSLVPTEEKDYRTIEDAIQMYVEYAEATGFDTRRGTERKTKDNKRVILKIMLCNKAGINHGVTGKRQTIEESFVAKKRSRIQVTGCLALVRFKHNDAEQKYKVVAFEARHNHCLMVKENHDMLWKRRQLIFEDMRFQHRVESLNARSSKEYRAKTMLNGGYGNAPGQVVDWRNFKRDKNKIIGLRDGQFLIDKLTCKKKCSPEFYLEYELTDKKVTSLFWADEAAKLNYVEFGDVDAEFERQPSKCRSVLEDCYNVLRKHPEGVKALNEKLDIIKRDIVDEFEPDWGTMTKRDIIPSLLGLEDTDNIEIQVPEGIRNKGSGRGNQMMSIHEKEAKKAKRIRRCQTCFKVGHDTRTCPIKGKYA